MNRVGDKNAGELRRLSRFVECKDRQLQTVTCSGFAEDALQVTLNRVLADVELGSDISIFHAASDGVGDLPLSVGKAMQ